MPDLAFTDATAAYIAYLKATRYSLNTVASYERIYARFGLSLPQAQPVATIKPSQVINYLASLEHVKAKTVLNHYIALSSLWSWLLSTGQASEHIVRKVPKPKAYPREILPLKQDEVRMLLKATEGQPWVGRASRAMIYMMLDNGLRSSEMCAAKVYDLDFSRGELRVLGKGNKERILPVSEFTLKQIRIYHDSRYNLRSDSPLFATGYDQPMQRRRLRRTLVRLGELADIPRVHPHRFRHTFAVNYLRNGGDIYTLQKILGHSTLEMVKRYLHLARDDIRNAHAKASPVLHWLADL